MDMDIKSHLLLLGAVVSALVLSSHAQKEVCYPPLGCFSSAHPWRTVARPMPTPASPQEIRTTFLMFTRERPAATYTVTTVPVEGSLRESDFSPRRRSVFVIHGFTERGGVPWMHALKDALLKQIDANVFITDWGHGSFEVGNYLQAASNTRVVGAQVARLVRRLKDEFGAKPEDVHLIGFSLGAQIAGYAGKALPGLGKITALDPAQPGFEGFDRAVRLTSDDASFVEAVHTSGRPFVPTFGFGFVNPVGHLDFYISNGAFQPGCQMAELPHVPRSLEDLTNLPVDVITRVVACDHTRAFQIYTEALLNPSCSFWGHSSNGVERFRNRPCTSNTCVRLQYDTGKHSKKGTWVVPTSRKAPYCISDPNKEVKEANDVVSSFFDFRRNVLDPITGAIQNAAAHLPIPLVG